jgi:hypothetical protein
MPTTELFNTFAIQGLDLRDYFAAKAMQGLLTTLKGEEWRGHEVAEIAYIVADDMLKARG